MQRFLPVGDARLQALGCVMHDPGDAPRVAGILEGMRPEVILVDRTVEEWTGPPDPFQTIVLENVPDLAPNALWKAVDASARRLRLEVALLHRQAPPPPPDGIKALRRMLAKEGFDATGDVRQDVMDLHQHYVVRCGPLWQWIEQRRDASAARIRAAFETRAARGVVVIAMPDMHAVCDRVQQMGRK